MTVLIRLGVSNFLVVWLLLEINFLSFVALLSTKQNPKRSTELITYFITQAFSSVGLVIILFLSLISPRLVSNMMPVVCIFLLIKLGIIPFHLWYTKIIINLNWELIWLLSSWQKAIPIYLIYLFKSSMTRVLYVAALANIILRGVFMYKQKTVKLLFLFSSLFALSWVLISLQIQAWVWIIFFIAYVIPFKFLTVLAIQQGIKNKFFSINLNPYHGLIILVIMSSLRGVPPFAIFYLKVFMVIIIIKQAPLVRVLILLARTLMVFNYLNLILKIFTLNRSVSLAQNKPQSMASRWLVLLTLIAPNWLIH